MQTSGVAFLPLIPLHSVTFLGWTAAAMPELYVFVVLSCTQQRRCFYRILIPPDFGNNIPRVLFSIQGRYSTDELGNEG